MNKFGLNKEDQLIEKLLQEKYDAVKLNPAKKVQMLETVLSSKSSFSFMNWAKVMVMPAVALGVFVVVLGSGVVSLNNEKNTFQIKSGVVEEERLDKVKVEEEDVEEELDSESGANWSQSVQKSNGSVRGGSNGSSNQGAANGNSAQQESFSQSGEISGDDSSSNSGASSSRSSERSLLPKDSGAQVESGLDADVNSKDSNLPAAEMKMQVETQFKVIDDSEMDESSQLPQKEANPAIEDTRPSDLDVLPPNQQIDSSFDLDLRNNLQLEGGDDGAALDSKPLILPNYVQPIFNKTLCESVCRSGELRCSTAVKNTPEFCLDSNKDGCFEWIQQQACADGLYCSEGKCLKK